MNKVGVYIGSFNPVHKGHMRIVNYLLEKKIVDKVLIVPTGNYWNKNDLATIGDRINIFKLCENDDIMVDRENNDALYTYLLLDRLSDRYGKDNLFLIVGADNIVNFDKWKRYEEILKYNLIIVDRDNIDVEYYLNKMNKHSEYLLINVPGCLNFSSSIVRNLIKKEQFKEALKFIDVEVLNYILSNNLYKN